MALEMLNRQKRRRASSLATGSSMGKAQPPHTGSSANALVMISVTVSRSAAVSADRLVIIECLHHLVEQQSADWPPRSVWCVTFSAAVSFGIGQLVGPRRPGDRLEEGIARSMTIELDLVDGPNCRWSGDVTQQCDLAEVVSRLTFPVDLDSRA